MSNYKSLNPTNEYVVQTIQARDDMLQQNILSIGDKVYVIADKKKYIVDFNNAFQEYQSSSGGGAGDSGYRWVSLGAKPSGNIPENSLGFEVDTGIMYYYTSADGWQPVPAPGVVVDPDIIGRAGYGATAIEAVVEEEPVAEKTVPWGGVWCEMTESDNDIYFMPFGLDPEESDLPEVIKNDSDEALLVAGYGYSHDSAVDEYQRLYVGGITLFVDANDTLGTPEGVLFRSATDDNGYIVFSNSDPAYPLYAEAKFEMVRGSYYGEAPEEWYTPVIGFKFVSAAFGTAPNATQDVTAYFSMLNPRMLFFCQGVEEVE